MEVVGTVLSVTQTLFAALQSAELKEFFSRFGYKSQLEDLQSTVTYIQAAFRDAERQQNLSQVQKKLIEDLKDAVYEADDLLDEFVTLAEQKQLLKADGTFSEKLRRFLARTNPFGVAKKMSKGVKKIKKKLDAIAYNKQFSFVHDPEPIRNRRPETCSYMNEGDIIGRDEDLEKILGMLTDSNNVQQDLSFLSIVGIGGMGKTALAQLVFNDPRVTSAFPLKLWACVSDQDQKQLDVKEVVGKILASVNPDEGSTLVEKQSKLQQQVAFLASVKSDEGSTLVEKQRKLQQQLAGKRYLLVLDDVWTEDREAWCGLVRYFVGGQRGSWVVVTTRSHRTATIIGSKVCQTHELQGLSEEDSWSLFQRTAFGSHEPNLFQDDDLFKLGRDIVEGCARVPLAIRVIGSLLYGQDKSKWQSVKDIGVSNIQKKEDGIMSILKLSYDHLESPLKSCFSYCALFPKDFELEKEMLIDLWIAQGYVVPFYDGQSPENAGEDYFSILLKRCFFQNFERKYRGIECCKMHDLIHDIDQSVSGKEIYTTFTTSGNMNEKVRHFSTPFKEYGNNSLNNIYVRSYILLSRDYHVLLGGDYHSSVKVENSFVEALISRCNSLRALNLAGLRMKSLPDSISTLLHLRYLDLSFNEDLEVLPKSISKLYNLQTLILIYCRKLKELPKDLSKLAKLRVLDITDCNGLSYMPRGMNKLTCLSRLSDFIVGSEGNNVSWKQWYDGLLELKALNGLKGQLRVELKWPQNTDNISTEVSIGKGCMLKSTEHLDCIYIYFGDAEKGDGGMDDRERIGLMEDLHPHPNLKSLEINYYQGTVMADWASLLQNLVELELWDCKNIKEWRRGIDGSSSGSGNNQALPCLPQLKSLMIQICPELRWIPLCPKLEILELRDFNKRLVFGPSASASFKQVENFCPKLKQIYIDNVAWLNSLPIEYFHYLENLGIINDYEVEKLGEVEEVFRSCSSSLRTLSINYCNNLKSVVGGGLEHLTALQELELNLCENLTLSEEEKEGEMSVPCLFLLPSIHTLTLYDIPKLENLPKWMQFMPALQTLKIINCRKLKTMPNWMSKLTSLRHLYVVGSLKSLERRCQKEPQGEDWPFIQHIPSITFINCYEETE